MSAATNVRWWMPFSSGSFASRSSVSLVLGICRTFLSFIAVFLQFVGNRWRRSKVRLRSGRPPPRRLGRWKPDPRRGRRSSPSLPVTRWLCPPTSPFLLWSSPSVRHFREPWSGGFHVVPPAPGFRPASGHAAVEEMRHDPHGRDPENPRPEPPRAAEPPRDGHEHRPLGDPHGYRLGPPGEHHAQFLANLLSKVHLSPSFLVRGPPRSPIIRLAASLRSPPSPLTFPGGQANFLQLVRNQ